MKRIFAQVLIICLVLSGTTVFGAGEDKLFNALTNVIYSGELEMTVGAKLNAPLEIIDVLIEADEYGYYEDVPVDFKMLFEGLLNSEYDISCKYNISKDYKKADMYFSLAASNPIDINDSLKIGAWSNWEMWMQYDFISETPVYKMILKTPVSKKYVVFDVSEVLKESPIASSHLMPDEEYTAEINGKMAALYKENSTVKKTSGGYKMTIDDAGFKNIFLGTFDIIIEMVEEQLLRMNLSESEITEAKSQFNQVKSAVEGSRDKFSIIGKDGFLYDLKVNTLGFITEGDLSLNIGLNVYDIMSAFGMEEECKKTGITKENSKIDFTVNAFEKYSKHNQNVKIDYPVLTEENSFNPVAPSGMAESGDYISEYKYFSVIEEGAPVVLNGKSYVKLRSVAEECGFDISFSDGVVLVDTKTSIGKVEYKLNSKEVKTGEGAFELTEPVIERGGATYVTEEALSYLNNSVNSVYYEGQSNLTYTYCDYYNPDYTEPEYEEETYFETEEGLSEYFWVEAEGSPVVEKEVIYIPLYPLLGEFNVATEEISINDGEIYVESDNSYVFKTLKLNENSIFAEKDGEELLIDNPVKNIDGNYWVGCDYAEKVLNSKLDYLRIGYGLTYGFNREVK